MRCDDVAELLLASDQQHDPELDRHVAECAKCGHIARGLVRLDAVLSASLVIQPPLELQQRLAQLAVAAARPQALPWWRRALQGELNLDWLVLRPNAVAAQGLAAVMLALASWQIFGWLNLFRPVIGDVGYAMELVAASPAVGYLGGVQIDVQSLALWSLIGIGGWLVSENGVIGQRLSSLTTRLRLS